MADIIYTYNGKPYLNITNQCPCACTFCIRSQNDGLGSARSLWHGADPTWPEIEQALEQTDFSGVEQVIFCGYGEPFCALDNLKRCAQWLKGRYPGVALRVNTNGLGDLINGRATAVELAGLVDAVSVSLNAPNAARYHELVRSRWGEAAFAAVLRFAEDCKAHIPSVKFSVVDVLTPEEIEACRAIADEMGIPLRVRVRA